MQPGAGSKGPSSIHTDPSPVHWPDLCICLTQLATCLHTCRRRHGEHTYACTKRHPSTCTHKPGTRATYLPARGSQTCHKKTCMCPRELMRKHTHARSGKHCIVYKHTLTLPVTAHVSISKTPLPLGPRPHTHDTHLLQAFPQVQGCAPVSRKRQHSPGGGGFPTSTLSRPGGPRAEPGLASLTDPAGTSGTPSSPAGCQG